MDDLNAHPTASTLTPSPTPTPTPTLTLTLIYLDYFNRELVTTRPTGTTTSSSMLSPYMVAFYPFDGNALDSYYTYNGTLVGGATFTAAGYIRQALLISGNAQYVQTNFINVAYQSFTISGWISTTNLINSTFFSECSALIARKCLTLGIRNQYLFMDFFGGFNTTGTTVLTTSKWFHMAFV